MNRLAFIFVLSLASCANARREVAPAEQTPAAQGPGSATSQEVDKTATSPSPVAKAPPALPRMIFDVPESKYPEPKMQGFAGSLSADGTRVSAFDPYFGVVWQADTGKQLLDKGGRLPANGKFVIPASEDYAEVIEIDTGESFRRDYDSEEGEISAAVTADGRVAFGSEATEIDFLEFHMPGAIHVAHETEERPAPLWSINASVSEDSLAFSPDGTSLLFVNTSRELIVIDLKTRRSRSIRLPRTLDYAPRALRVSPLGDRALLQYSETILVVDLKSKKKTQIKEDQSAWFLADGRIVVARDNAIFDLAGPADTALAQVNKSEADQILDAVLLGASLRLLVRKGTEVKVLDVPAS